MKPLCIRGSLGRAFERIRAKLLKVRQLISPHADSDQVNSLPRPAEMTRASDAAIPNKKRCQICLEVSDEKEFVFKCRNCRDGYFCAECLGKWFLDACRNETKMPPKCCSIIPVKSVSGILSDAEVSGYNSIHIGCSLRASKLLLPIHIRASYFLSGLIIT